jgi:UPF0716 family protein affecting phage T7 exclusion
MTKEDFEKIERMTEDRMWVTIAFVALLLGHWFVFGLCLLMPIVGRALEKFFIRRRIQQLEQQLAGDPR